MKNKSNLYLILILGIFLNACSVGDEILDSGEFELKIINWDASQEFIVEESYEIIVELRNTVGIVPVNNKRLIVRNFSNGEKINEEIITTNNNGQAVIDWGFGNDLYHLQMIDICLEDNSSCVSLEAVPNFFRDKRDGNLYKTVELEGEIWMAQNLNYSAFGNCYNNQAANCEKFGRMYTFQEVAQVIFAEQVTLPHRGICPEGWKLPESREVQRIINRYPIEGNKYIELLSCPELWTNWISDTSINNASGFSLKSGGYFNGVTQEFTAVDSWANFWIIDGDGNEGQKYYQLFISELLVHQIRELNNESEEDYKRYCRCLKIN